MRPPPASVLLSSPFFPAPRRKSRTAGNNGFSPAPPPLSSCKLSLAQKSQQPKGDHLHSPPCPNPHRGNFSKGRRAIGGGGRRGGVQNTWHGEREGKGSDLQEQQQQQQRERKRKQRKRSPAAAASRGGEELGACLGFFVLGLCVCVFRLGDPITSPRPTSPPSPKHYTLLSPDPLTSLSPPP